MFVDFITCPDDIYKDWETKVNDLSLDEQEVDKFMDVSI